MTHIISHNYMKIELYNLRNHSAYQKSGTTIYILAAPFSVLIMTINRAPAKLNQYQFILWNTIAQN